MSYANIGSSNLPIYDCCKYAQNVKQSTAPLSYQLYFGANENCSRCVYDKIWFKQDPEIVDIESELRNQTRPLSNCSINKYNPDCKTSSKCISTFAPNIPRVISPSLCPIVFNNIPRPTNVGYTVPNQQVCDKNDYQNMNQNNNSMGGYDNNTRNIQYATLNTFIDDNKPLWNGGTEQVKL